MDKKTWAVLTAGAAGAIALGTAVPVLAQETTTPSATPSATSTLSGGASGDASAPADRDARRAERRAEYAQKLAAELGVPVERVTAALEKVDQERRAEGRTGRLAALRERLAQAVTDGRLTQAQADAIVAAAEKGVALGRGGGFGGGGPGGPGGPGGRGQHGGVSS